MNLDFLAHEVSEDARAALQSAVRIIKQVGIFKGGKKKFVGSSDLVSNSPVQSAILTKIIAEIEGSFDKQIRQMTEQEAIEVLRMLSDLERGLGPKKSSVSSLLADDFLARLAEGKL